MLYLALVMAPLFVLLAGPMPEGIGFWHDLSIALGFAGLSMMGAQFFLTARFRRASAPYGTDIIYYFHRYLAIIGLALIFVHILMITVPILFALDNLVVLSLLNPFTASWDMISGAISALLFVVVIATSLWRKKLKIDYDSWRIWHGILAVAALVFAIIHIELIGYYINAPWKRALWIIIPATLILLLIYVRLVKPLLMLRKPYRVVEVIKERGVAWTLALEPDGHQGMNYLPGQFAWLTLRNSPFTVREHPFSFSSSPVKGERLEFTIKELGDFTQMIKDTKPGEAAYLDGPHGLFSIDRYRKAKGYVFIAGGIGIAPIMSMLRSLADRNDRQPLHLIYAYTNWNGLTFREELAHLEEKLNISMTYVLQEPHPGWDGEIGFVTREILKRNLPEDRASYEYFLCGPVVMKRAVEKNLKSLGVPFARIHSELFDLV